MTHAVSALDRIVVFLVGLLLILAGLVPAALYWDIPYATEYADRIDRASISHASIEPWFAGALIGTLIGAILFGLWFILANIRNRSFNNRDAQPADAEHGSTVLDVQSIADAASERLAASPLVDNARARVSYVGSRPTVTFTVTANPAYGFAEVTDLLETSDAELAQAIPGIDIDSVYKLHLERISS